jgi:predicted enzyme involved in methoxymalonyl-ACP biosynthesis
MEGYSEPIKRISWKLYVNMTSILFIDDKLLEPEISNVGVTGLNHYWYMKRRVEYVEAYQRAQRDLITQLRAENII